MINTEFVQNTKVAIERVTGGAVYTVTETEEASEAAAETELVMDAVPVKKDTGSDKSRGKTATGGGQRQN